MSTLAEDDTIYALSTAPGRAAIAVIRVSGPACLAIYEQLCPNKPQPKPRTATLRALQSPANAKNILDASALILHLPGPRTATGEDILELHVHGGPAIVRGVLEAIPQCVAREGQKSTIRPAGAGEFTKRAFYNGRIDLTEVEALGETLTAETEQQRRLAVSGAASALTQRYEGWRSMLLYARGELEALIDFSEDQHFDESPAELMGGTSTQVLELKKQLELHILNSGRGELLRSGINVALLGAPNAGKSSLLNRIVGREAAIVSAEEGTTRDIVDVSIDLQGWLVKLGDMAGLRAGIAPFQVTAQNASGAASGVASAVGAIEQEGIRRARERALQSDLVIILISLQYTPEGRIELALNEELLAAVNQCHEAGKELLFAVNKIDLLHHQIRPGKVTLSKILSCLVDRFPLISSNDIFCLSCRDADTQNPNEPDSGGLQTFISGLVHKFSSMTSAAAGLTDEQSAPMSPAEAQSYWTASLGVTHRQSQYLQECTMHLQKFLEISCPGAATEDIPASISIQTIRTNSVPDSVFFDTTDTTSRNPLSQDWKYRTNNHDDLVAEVEHEITPTMPLSESTARIPYSWAADKAGQTYDDMTEVDIVTAAEHLRYAADCLAKLTGRGDGASSGADVEDVLGVVFEK